MGSERNRMERDCDVNHFLLSHLAATSVFSVVVSSSPFSQQLRKSAVEPGMFFFLYWLELDFDNLVHPCFCNLILM